MEVHTLEIIASIVTTAAISVAGGWKLLDLRLAKFQNELMDKLNGTYVRQRECILMHRQTAEKLDKLRANSLQLRSEK